VPVNANAVASPNVASFMIAPFSWCVTANEVRRRCVPDRGSQFVAVPGDIHRPQFGNRNDALVGSLRQLRVASRYFHIPSQLKIVQLNVLRYQGHQGPSIPLAWNAPCLLLSSFCCSISR
jgi:hypothetical protein